MNIWYERRAAQTSKKRRLLTYLWIGECSHNVVGLLELIFAASTVNHITRIYPSRLGIIPLSTLLRGLSNVSGFPWLST